MAEANTATLSSATGTFKALQPPTGSDDSRNGNRVPASGNNVPVKERSGPDVEELARALNLANQSIGRDLRFEVDMEKGRSVIQVLDRDTGEVIRQIPPEKARLYLNRDGGVQLRLYSNRV